MSNFVDKKYENIILKILFLLYNFNRYFFMNKAYFLGKLIGISDVRFDYNKKLEASIILSILDEENNQNFDIYASEKHCDFIINNLNLFDILYFECHVNSIDKIFELDRLEFF